MTAFDTEDKIDVVDIYVGGSSVKTSDYVASLSGLIDGGKLPTYVSTNNFMIVIFTSDKDVQKKGFTAKFTAGKIRNVLKNYSAIFAIKGKQ